MISNFDQSILNKRIQYQRDLESGLFARGHFRYTNRDGESVTTETHPLVGIHYVGKHYKGN